MSEDALQTRVAELESHAELGWQEAKRVSAKLAEAGVEDDGAAVRVLPADRIKQLDQAKEVLEAVKELICPNGSLIEPEVHDFDDEGDQRGVVLLCGAYGRARQTLARYEKAWGFFGSKSLEDEARPGS